MRENVLAAAWAMSPGWKPTGSIRSGQHYFDAHGLALCGRKLVAVDPGEHFTERDPYPHMRYCGTCQAIRTRMLGGFVKHPDASTLAWLGIAPRQHTENEVLNGTTPKD
jgi:hypothetical protein